MNESEIRQIVQDVYDKAGGGRTGAIAMNQLMQAALELQGQAAAEAAAAED